MAQTYTADVFDTTHVGTTDLQNIENNFAALKSNFSGTSAPSNVVGGQFWSDSTALKYRNYANSAWLGVLLGDASQKMWVYRNDTCEGWTIDATVTDKVLSIKGGAQAYNVNGGNTAGSWTLSGLSMAHTHTMAHNHQWFNSNAGYDSGGSNANWSTTSYNSTTIIDAHLVGLDSESGLTGSYYTSNCSSNSGAASTSTVASAATWRPAAAVGTLQYPDLS